MEIIRDILSYEAVDQLIKREENLIIYFGTDTWSVCISVFPQLENLVNKYDIKILKVDVASQRQLVGQFLAFVVPTILVFNEGKEVLRESKFIDFDRIQRTLEILFEE